MIRLVGDDALVATGQSAARLENEYFTETCARWSIPVAPSASVRRPHV